MAAGIGIGYKLLTGHLKESMHEVTEDLTAGETITEDEMVKLKASLHNQIEKYFE